MQTTKNKNTLSLWKNRIKGQIKNKSDEIIQT